MAAACGSMPDPAAHPDSWIRFAAAEPEKWSQAVQSVHFFESVCDGASSSMASPGAGHGARGAACEGVVLSWRCDRCDRGFASTKALASHMR
eukprot:2577889-Lingulodinium_polyedra.AAC.1